MDKIFDALETLYGGSGIPFFLTDEYGNVHWRNSACGTAIIFPKGINDTSLTDKVSIDGKIFAAQASKLSSRGKTLILWRVNTLTDILMQLGSTDTYPDICYMLAQAKNDIEKAEKNCLNKKALNNLLRNIEVLTELSNVIYGKTQSAPAVYFLEQLKLIAEEANRVLGDIPVLFKVDADQSITEDVPVNTGQRMFYVCIFSILKAMVRCSDKYLFNLKVGKNANYVTLYCSFSLKNDTHSGMISDDFEMYCAKLYIRHIGGIMRYTVNNDIANINLSIPIGSGIALNSPSFIPSADICPKIAEIFMSGTVDTHKEIK